MCAISVLFILQSLPQFVRDEEGPVCMQHVPYPRYGTESEHGIREYDLLCQTQYIRTFLSAWSLQVNRRVIVHFEHIAGLVGFENHG